MDPVRRWQVTIERYANYPAGDDVIEVFDTWAEARDLMVSDLRRFEDAPGGLSAVIPHFLDQLAALREGEHHYLTTACGQYTLEGEIGPDGTPVFPAGEERQVTGTMGFLGRRNPPYVTVDPDCWARGPWQALAVTLAEPLRKAYEAHVEWHGCGCSPRHCPTPERHEANGGHALPGVAYCEPAQELWRLLPEGDQVIVAYAH